MGDRITQMLNIQSKALELFTKKNTDYGDAFARYGIIGVLIRIQDKIQRALSITSNNINLVEDEAISDTLLDLHNYAAMALMLMEEGKADNYLETNTEQAAINFLELDDEDDCIDDGNFSYELCDNYPGNLNPYSFYDPECGRFDDENTKQEC